MKRLLVSALLAGLVHAYWLFGPVAQSDGASPRNPPRSVVISLVTNVPGSASRPETELDIESETDAQRHTPAPAAAEPIVEQRQDAPVEEGDEAALDARVEPEAKGDRIPTDPPTIAQSGAELAQAGCAASEGP